MKFLLAPIICAFIGWLTNYIAVKMLFHPRKPVKLLSFTIQGVFPKRQAALAKSLGALVERELLSPAEIGCAIKENGLGGSIKAAIEEQVDIFLRQKIVAAIPMAAMVLNDQTINQLKEMFVPELEKMIPGLLDKAACELEDGLNISELVQEKVEAFSIEKLEEILFSIMQREFKFIELVGGVLGFAIGVFQSVLFYAAA